MDEDLPMMTCEWCGKDFPADARACVEAGITACYADEEGEEWKDSQDPVNLPPGHFAASTREKMKVEMGLDDNELDTLLTTGSVEGLGAIICLECQDKWSEESEY